jgi:glutamate dehydrogenase
MPLQAVSPNALRLLPCRQNNDMAGEETMASRAAKAKAGGAEDGRSGSEAERLRSIMTARAPAEDIAAYADDELDKAAALALAALRKHRRGDSIVDVAARSDVRREDRPVSIVTVVNDNMPFLFDSVMGEITGSLGEPALVMHPVVIVRHGPKGVTEIVGDAGLARGDGGADRVSLIQVHVTPLSAERAERLAERLGHVLGQVRAAVADWRPMLARLEQAIVGFRYNPIPLKKEAVAEAIAFLEWLRDDNFTFLGLREYRYSGGEKTGTLDRTDSPGLGILADPDLRVLRIGAEAVTTTPEIRAFLHGPDPLIVTKANAKSVVHRRIYLDYVGVKTFDRKGNLEGELRVVGLFTSSAYTRSVMKIPYLRSKAEAVIAKSGLDPADHSGKALINVLESYPRDELFQIGVPLLRKHAEAVLALGERPRVRALPRTDQFDRFVSVLVFVPRDRYDSQVRERIGDYLAEVFDGHVSAYYPAFPEGGLARVHFIVGRSGGKTPKVEAATLETAIREIVRTWEDAIEEVAVETEAAPGLAEIARRFPESYRRSFSARDALADAARIVGIAEERPIAIDFRRREGHGDGQAALMIYHLGEPVALSRRVPLLENMGFRVISERTFETRGEGDRAVFVHDMELEAAGSAKIDLSDRGALLEDVFLSIWNGAADNDGYAALVQTARLAASEIAVLRAYGRYLQQAGIPQSQDFVAAALNRYPAIARGLFQLFSARFDPEHKDDRAVTAKHLKSALRDALNDVPSLDDDTIVRRYIGLIEATLRTNHFLSGEAAKGISLALKLDPSGIDGLPEPRPWREIFVYGPEVEGVHLRYGPVARGGLRWSDRAQDYRTEVLGLVKAQQVKNAVIVPVGAKGGFYPKRLPVGGGRDAIFEAGRAAYVNFVSSLLSVTDNIDGDRVVPPAGIVRHDADDPYFVVAADKGTATFSDTANAISRERGFWLDDAFASGGSAGYDHKKMGITARGAWEAVKRHFREMNRDIQADPFTVVGVGDMSGDVFGNGMLLSRKIRLVAAFDHRDIFIDPAPDTESSFVERERVFALPRSSWQDYDKSKLSKGGAIISRSQKSVTLSAEAAEAIGLDRQTASPFEIMKAILKAKVDLLWFGGIGTYVRAEAESTQDVGDRANDMIRVTASEVGARVVGEGANLGMTQRARIEYGRAGGRCNSDAIDNSAGVNSSDVEVNIKIALAAAMRSGDLKRPQRDKLLAAMTDEVAGLVLENNYRQTLAISLVQRRGVEDLLHQQRFMSNLEERGLLDRAVEMLPSDATIADRLARGEALTRAEIGVLLAYSKIVLFRDLVETDLPDDDHLEGELLAYFPGRMAKKYDAEIKAHRLRREIIATRVANAVVNAAGPSFVNRLRELTGCGAAMSAAAFVAVRDGFELDRLTDAIDALDGKVDGMDQLDLYAAVTRLLHAASGWYLKNEPGRAVVGERIESIRTARKALEPRLASMLPAYMADRLAERTHALFKAGAPEPLAEKLALCSVLDLLPDIALVARRAKAELLPAAHAFFAVTEAFRIGRMEEATRAIPAIDYYDGLALSRANDMIDRARRDITVAALAAHGRADDPVAAWLEKGGGRIAGAREQLHALVEAGDITLSRLTVAAGLLADLADR